MKNALNTFFANWDSSYQPNWVSPREIHAYGYSQFVADYAQETRTALADNELEQLAADVAYIANENDVDVTEEEAAAWLTDNRDMLIKAIDAQMDLTGN